MNLVALLMAIGLGAIALTYFSGTFVNMWKGEKRAQIHDELAAIKFVLLNRVYCDNSLKVDTCSSAGTLISLYDRFNRKIIGNSGSGTKIGSWTVRAECGYQGESIIVRAAILKDSGSLTSTNSSHFEKHPITKNIENWDSDATLLFPSSIQLCAINNKFEQSFPEPTYVSDWERVPVTFNHNLQTDAYIVRSLYEEIEGSGVTDLSGILVHSYDETYIKGLAVERMIHYRPSNNSIRIKNLSYRWGSLDLSVFSGHRARKVRVTIWQYDE